MASKFNATERWQRMMRSVFLFHNRNKVQGIEQRGLSEIQLELAFDLIEEGLDYEARDRNGASVFGNLINTVGNTYLVCNLLWEMIKQGGNPLKAPKFDQFQLFKHKGACEELERILAQEEAEGRGLRNETGGNLYHSQAELCLAGLANNLVALTRQQPGRGQKPFKHNELGRMPWLNARDDQGNTLLHVLWGIDAIRWTLEDPLNDPRPDRRPPHEDSLLTNRLSLTNHLLDFGANFLDTNHAGVRVWDLIEAYDFPGWAEDMDVIKKWRVTTETRILDMDTPGAQLRSRPTARL